MASPWFRVWADMANDPKWRTIAGRSNQKIGDVIAVYVHMMTMASNATERGRTQGWCDEDVATALDIREEQVRAIRDEMQGRVLDGDRLTGWEKRQPGREDGSAERSKAWRDKKAASERTEPQPNAGERIRTLDKRREDIDKSREEKKKTPTPPPALPEWVPADALAAFVAMRKAIKKPLTDSALPLAIQKLDQLRQVGNDPQQVLEQSTMNSWQGLFELKAQAARDSPNGAPQQLGKAGQATARAAEQWLREQNHG